jgi:hypothetical protein
LVTVAARNDTQPGAAKRHTDRSKEKEHTMKVFAVGTITNPPTPEQQQQIMPKEVPDTLQLYLDGKIEQFWFRQDRPGVIFLMNVPSIDDAKAAVDALPLTEGGFMTFDLTPVGPLMPLARLIQK